MYQAGKLRGFLVGHEKLPGRTYYYIITPVAEWNYSAVALAEENLSRRHEIVRQSEPRFGRSAVEIRIPPVTVKYTVPRYSFLLKPLTVRR